MNPPLEVMLVEDEVPISLLIAHRLADLGYTVTSMAYSGEEALALAAAKPPHVVIMDIGLPGGLDGIETARRLKENFGAVILFVTGYEDADTRSRAEALGPVGYLPKPVEFERVRRVLEGLGGDGRGKDA